MNRRKIIVFTMVLIILTGCISTAFACGVRTLYRTYTHTYGIYNVACTYNSYWDNGKFVGNASGSLSASPVGSWVTLSNKSSSFITTSDKTRVKVSYGARWTDSAGNTGVESYYTYYSHWNNNCPVQVK